MPGYIRYIAGIDTSSTTIGSRAIAVQSTDPSTSYLYSTDGFGWTPLTVNDFLTAVNSSTFIKTTVVEALAGISPLTLGDGWTANELGLTLAGSLKVDWKTCC
jgi:hypothetical protein